MMQEENNKTKTKEESGIAENEKANYSTVDSSPAKNDQEEEEPSIKQTDKEDQKDATGGDLAGNASGNSSAD